MESTVAKNGDDKVRISECTRMRVGFLMVLVGSAGEPTGRLSWMTRSPGGPPGMISMTSGVANGGESLGFFFGGVELLRSGLSMGEFGLGRAN